MFVRSWICAGCACTVLGFACQFDTTGFGGGAPPSDAATDAAGPSVFDATPPGTPDAPATPDAEPGTPDAPPPPPRFAKTLTFDGASIAGDLDDFPVYIEVVDSDLEARSEVDGSDIYFTDATGTNSLDFEIQRWDAASGRLEAWVRIPHFTAGADLDVEIHYGDVTTAAAPNPTGVWKAGYVVVFHLEEPPDGGTDAILDSLGVRHGTSQGAMTDTDLVAATLGFGIELDGNNDQIGFDNPLLGSSPHTMSAWVDQQTTGNNDALLVLGNGSCGHARWLHSRYTGGDVGAGFYCDDFTAGGVDLQGDGPTLVHWTYDASDESRLYVDGALAHGPVSHAGTQDTQGTSGRIGNAPSAFGSSMGLNGVVDEVHIATVARDAGWIATEFANQSDPGAFVSVGPEREL